MSQNNKRSIYLVLSSDSDTSIHENELPTQAATTIRNQTNSLISDINRTGTNELYISSQDNLSHEQLESSSTLLNANNVTTALTDIIKINNDTSAQQDTIIENNNLLENENNIEIRATTSGSTANLRNTPSNTFIQMPIDRYFPSINRTTQDIGSLHENMMTFRFHCKVIYISPIRTFGQGCRIFDAIVCDMNDEIKVLAFNDEIDRFYDSISLNKNVTIKNGQIKKANELFRIPYTMYEILLLPNSEINVYNVIDFHPIIKITKMQIRDIGQITHGTDVDLEGKIIADRGLYTKTSETNQIIFTRRTLKIKDETGAIYIKIWNTKIDEIPEILMGKTMRIRNGIINQFNDYVSINVSQRTIIQFFKITLTIEHI
ncbi:unnamed protein product [Rotaria magnacalcarata]|uniref:Uncharacterized protein n=1 Tax=Rotaria magnacalcarata TaxID=392030 RepID=A0A8S2NR22_9BILA|nr:unnamed protein product [Rotaria magnacalcarata]CAF4013758.1 unnamed protein product [Rotaria magnacalcarata]